MKKSLVLGFLILFVLSTAAFAGFTDPKKESEKPAVKESKENKLSDEELSRMNRRAGIDNLSKTKFSNTEMNDLKKNNAKQVVVVENRHHGGYIWVGGGGLLLLIILIIILV